jgi:hypothetical protein
MGWTMLDAVDIDVRTAIMWVAAPRARMRPGPAGTSSAGVRIENSNCKCTLVTVTPDPEVKPPLVTHESGTPPGLRAARARHDSRDRTPNPWPKRKSPDPTRPDPTRAARRARGERRGPVTHTGPAVRPRRYQRARIRNQPPCARPALRQTQLTIQGEGEALGRSHLGRSQSVLTQDAPIQ